MQKLNFGHVCWQNIEPFVLQLARYMPVIRPWIIQEISCSKKFFCERLSLSLIVPINTSLMQFRVIQ